ncbi:MAG: hypothetical protein JXB47_12240 [Anaerolineae bacterium]|nr:hypothetical protein [Anaerolineae bacterium]
MSYATGESNALTILRTASAFDAANSVSLANDNPAGGYGRLDGGAAAQYAFLKPGPCTRLLSTLAHVATKWTTIIELWVRYADPSAYQALASVRQDALEAFDKYRALDGMDGVARSFIEAGGPVQVEKSPGGGVRYLRQDLILTWEETYKPTLED